MDCCCNIPLQRQEVSTYGRNAGGVSCFFPHKWRGFTAVTVVPEVVKSGAATFTNGDSGKQICELLQ